MAIATSTLLPACTSGSENTAATGCSSTVAQASRATEVDQQVRDLDAALVACRSYAALSEQLDRYPGIIGYDDLTFITLRCTNVDDDTIRDSPVCASVVTPDTMAPPTTQVELVYVGDTLDGRQVEIRPGATTEFAGDIPAVVQQTVDIAIESGCEGVIAQRDLWAARIGDPAIGDEASVYAQHAQNVANYIQCDVPPLGP